ncbi:hypothetical protein Rs2_34307 [Raphanus sativus]|uniref:Uncharacterized protein LOC108815352 n=1 Tax=Raphanus sativus TaxID=3726 RepID=A0A6J0K683_RAPSA|nr:uncharacterized protein LOC108815352 [Raphanus sativus]KAJ4884214.1 hypothetical protein Rs2_34307 [Raphanus sativus]
MVLPGEGDSTATGHERPTKKKALHNFRLPNLNWGVQQTLRCVKVEPHGGSGDEEGIEEFRERMMLDIRTVKESIFREHVLGYEEDDHTNERDESEQPREREREVSPTVEVKRWNFRKRRGECEAMELGFVEEKVNTSSLMRSRFISTLSKKEVEDDMMKMTGQLPPRRPKKRPRAVQKKINFLHPAFYFSEEVTEDIY